MGNDKLELIINIDDKGFTYKTPTDKGTFTIPISMIDRKKVNQYLTKV